jgi:competence protein ComEC
MTGRFSSLKTVLAASLIVHLAFDPTAVSEIGFQLSYAAIFGIAYIFPWLRKMWRNDWPGLKWIWESLALSISCQITTGPLAYCYFGTFPQYFLLTNLIAVPLAGLIIPASLTTVALTALGCCPAFVIEITEWLVGTMTDSLSIIASM